MTSKAATSNVEKTREKFEEPVNTYGQVVRMEQIWRDSNLMPITAPSIDDATFMQKDDYSVAHVKRFNDGATIRNLIEKRICKPPEGASFNFQFSTFNGNKYLASRAKLCYNIRV